MRVEEERQRKSALRGVVAARRNCAQTRGHTREGQGGAGIGAKNIKSREGGLTALEGDLRKAWGRSFLRWEKDNVKGTKLPLLGTGMVKKTFSRLD